MFRKNEKQSLLKARTKSLINAEQRVEELREENIALYEENKELRYENEELIEFKNKVIRIMTAKDTIVNKYDKIKELITDDQSNN